MTHVAPITHAERIHAWIVSRRLHDLEPSGAEQAVAGMGAAELESLDKFLVDVVRPMRAAIDEENRQKEAQRREKFETRLAEHLRKIAGLEGATAEIQRAAQGCESALRVLLAAVDAARAALPVGWPVAPFQRPTAANLVATAVARIYSDKPSALADAMTADALALVEKLRAETPRFDA